MLVLLPVLLLSLTLLALLLLVRAKKAVGFAWLFSIISALGVWIIVLVQHFKPPAAFTLAEWLLEESGAASLVFQLDQSSWPFAFGLVSLLLAVLLTAAARFSYEDNLWPWVGSLFITIGGLLSVMATTPLALIFAWTVIDTFEFLIIIQTVDNISQRRSAVISLGARLAGILLVVWAVVDSRGRGQALTLESFPPEDGIFLLLAAGLRLGVIPLHLPYTSEPGLRRELGTAIRLVGPAASLVLLSRLPPTVVPPNLAPYFLFFTAIA